MQALSFLNETSPDSASTGSEAMLITVVAHEDYTPSTPHHELDEALVFVHPAIDQQANVPRMAPVRFRRFIQPWPHGGINE